MTSRPHRPLLAALAVLALLAGPGTGTALGHAELDTVTPADKSTVQGSPAQIVMTFTQDLDPAKSSIRIVDSGGKVVLQGGTVPAGSPREMDLAIATPLAAGAYQIRWISFSSEDDERDSGTTTFSVTAAPPSAAPSVAPTTAAPSASVAVPSSAPSVAASAAPSPPPTTPATSAADAVIPIVVALIVLAGLGLWLLRGRARAR